MNKYKPKYLHPVVLQAETQTRNTYRQETQGWAARWNPGSTATWWCYHWSWHPWISTGNLRGTGMSRHSQFPGASLPSPLCPAYGWDQSRFPRQSAHLGRGQVGCQCRWSTGRWWCKPESSSTWARPPRWLFFCVDTRHRSANRHESWHRNPSAVRSRSPTLGNRSV